MAGQAPPGSGGVIFTPWLNGERTPVEDRFIRGGFHNLSLSASREDLVRAVFEGVALNTRWLLQAVERFTRRRLEPIRIIGGGARSDVWCQIFADVLDRTIDQVSDPVNAGTRGAGLLAAVGLGELTFDQVPDRVPVAASYRPDPAAAELYDDLFREFTGLYRRNRKAHASPQPRACTKAVALSPGTTVKTASSVGTTIATAYESGKLAWGAGELTQQCPSRSRLAFAWSGPGRGAWRVGGMGAGVVGNRALWPTIRTFGVAANCLARRTGRVQSGGQCVVAAATATRCAGRHQSV